MNTFLKRKKKVIASVAAVIVFFVAVISVFYFGYQLGRKNPLVVKVEGVTNADELKVADFGLFWQAWQAVNDRYLNNQNIGTQDKIYGAIKGLVGSLNDPYSEFFTPSDSKKFQEDIQGNFGGIGAELGTKNGQVIVVTPLKNSPAMQAGLKSNDQILQVDKTLTNNLSVTDVVKLIRGTEGTTVALMIMRADWDKPKEFKIVRQIITIPTLDYQMKSGDIAYVQLYSFNDNTNLLFYQAMFQALTHGARGMVFDLRNDPGGYLQVAVDLAGWFLPRGSVVVKEAGRDGKISQTLRANGNEVLVNFPVVVLINGGSASAAEILSGALRDDRRIKLIGEQSFGKGSVQEVDELSNGATLKITIAHWVLPSGQILEGQGLKPDIEVKLTDDDVKNNRDPQLDRALEVVQSEIK